MWKQGMVALFAFGCTSATQQSESYLYSTPKENPAVDSVKRGTELDSFNDINNKIKKDYAKESVWQTDAEVTGKIKSRVDTLLKSPLTMESVLQIAFLNNAGLQSSYEQVGFAKVDVSEAILFENPIITGGARFGSEGTQLELNIVQSFAGIFNRSQRKQSAKANEQAILLGLVGEINIFVHEVRNAYINFQFGLEKLRFEKEKYHASKTALKFAERLHAAGNIDDFDYVRQVDENIEIEKGVAEVEADNEKLRENLNRFMGLWGEKAQSWTINPQINAIPEKEAYPVGVVEGLAISRRSELAASQKRVQALKDALEFSKESWFYTFDLGIGAEKDPGGGSLVGPEISFDIPIFSKKEIQIERLEVALRESEQRTKHLAINIRSEARDAQNDIIASRKKANYYLHSVIPTKQKLISLVQQKYNGMLAGVFDLLKAKQEESTAQREYIDALRDYWIARSNLDFQLEGGSFSYDQNNISQENEAK